MTAKKKPTKATLLAALKAADQETRTYALRQLIIDLPEADAVALVVVTKQGIFARGAYVPRPHPKVIENA